MALMLLSLYSLLAPAIKFVVEALAGLSGIYRVENDGTTSLVLAAIGLVGLAFDPRGGMVVVSSDAAYRLNLPLLPLSSGL